MERLINRTQAGQLLAKKLIKYSHNPQAIVLGLPRGGIPVAYEISQALQIPLDAFLVRKIGVPWHEELAMGAIAQGNVTVFNDEIINGLEVSKAEVAAIVAEEQQELQRRNHLYRQDQPLPSLKNKIIILVDDGLATGATLRAAIAAIKQHHPAKIIVALPVAAKESYEQFKNMVDEMICLILPEDFYSISQWYEDFSQTTDEEVIQLLKLY